MAVARGVAALPADKRFFLQEASTRGGGGGLYAPSAYYAAKVTATSPLNMIIAITFDLIGCGVRGGQGSCELCICRCRPRLACA